MFMFRYFFEKSWKHDFVRRYWWMLSHQSWDGLRQNFSLLRKCGSRRYEKKEAGERGGTCEKEGRRKAIEEEQIG